MEQAPTVVWAYIVSPGIAPVWNTLCLEQAFWTLAPERCGKLAWTPLGGRHMALTALSVMGLLNVGAQEVQTCRLDPVGGRPLVLALLSRALNSVFVDTE